MPRPIGNEGRVGEDLVESTPSQRRRGRFQELAVEMGSFRIAPCPAFVASRAAAAASAFGSAPGHVEHGNVTGPEEKAAAEKADADERTKSASADKSDKKRSPLFSDNDEDEWVDYDETSSSEEAIYGNKRKPKADATDPKTPQVDRHRTPVVL